MTRTIAICNQKGGVGKTTTTLNLGVGLARQGKKVLLVDADPQSDLTSSLGWNGDSLEKSLGRLMYLATQEYRPIVQDSIIHHPEGVDLIPSNLDLSSMETQLVNAMSREKILSNLLKDVKKDYDYILIDCIYESLPYHNCIFIGYDEAGRVAYACYRATNGERLMGDAAGSDKKYAFRINSAGSTLHVFESAIDLLSYATIMKMRTGEWRAEPMVSLGGVYAPSSNSKQSKPPVALENAMQNQTQINTIALHLDNDYAGRAASESIALHLCDNYAVRNEPPRYGKDCNDHLQYLNNRNRCRQMDELR